MDLYGAVMVLLIGLPFAVIGWVGGMLTMRKNYLNLLRGARVETHRVLRYAEQRAKNERYLGYAVGYREGARQ